MFYIDFLHITIHLIIDSMHMRRFFPCAAILLGLVAESALQAVVFLQLKTHRSDPPNTNQLPDCEPVVGEGDQEIMTAPKTQSPLFNSDIKLSLNSIEDVIIMLLNWLDNSGWDYGISQGGCLLGVGTTSGTNLPIIALKLS